jgi:hypothetical protein
MPQFVPANNRPRPETSLPLVRLTLRGLPSGEVQKELRQDAILFSTDSFADIALPEGVEVQALAAVVNGSLRIRRLDQPEQPARWLRVKEEYQLGPYQLRLDFLADTSLSAHKYQAQTVPSDVTQLKSQLERDKADWEADATRQAETLAARSRELQERDKQLQADRAELEQLRLSLNRATVPVELQTVREELLKLRDTLYQQYRQRRDGLVAMREAVRHAASKVQEEKRAHRQAEAERHEQLAQLEAEKHQCQEDRNDIARQAKLLEEWQQQLQHDQKSLANDQATLAAEQASYIQKSKELHEDLVRLQRQHEAQDRREAHLQARTAELDQREHYWATELPKLQGLQAEIATRQTQLAAITSEQTTERQTLTQRAAELEQLSQQLQRERQALADRLQGCTDWERQLGHDRLRLDRLEADLAQRSERLEQEIAEQTAAAEAWQLQLAESEAEHTRLQAEVATARQVLAEREDFEQRMAAEQAALDEARVEQRHQAELLQHRLHRVQQLRLRLRERRQALQQQLQVVTHSESAHESLQEQLRRRMATLTQREATQQELEASYGARLQQVQLDQEALHQQQAAWQASTQAERAELDARRAVLDEQVLQLKKDREKLAEMQAALVAQHQQLDAEKAQALAERDAAKAQLSSLETSKARFAETLPTLLRNAELALERLGIARSQLRTQLHDIHAYRQRCLDEVAAQRREVQQLAAQLEERQTVLSRLQDEQRLEAASLRQDVLHWQTQVKLLQGDWQASQEDLSEKEQRIASQKRELEQNHSRLQLQQESLDDQARDVDHRRSEVNKHLSDMQGWYRDKLRDMAEKKLPQSPSDEEAEALERPHILPLKSTRTGSDQELADLLSGMGLIDANTLSSLMEEARQQRSSLRDLLVQNDYLTGFQMELIEAGRLEALVLGPLRVIDRLRIGPMETIYRVFDPRLGDEALLRQLSAAVDPAWQEEYRTLFQQAAQLHHPHVAGTFEVMAMAGSPAVLQEWVVGLPGSEWQQIVTEPSVGLRLITQLAGGLKALHDVGLVHGQLHLGRLLLTPAGELKLCGAGEPRWLSGLASTTEVTMADDVATLIPFILPWCRGRHKLPGSALAEFVKKLEAGQIKTADQLHTAAYATLRSLPQDEKAWQELLHFVGDRLNAGEPVALKKSA